MKTIIAKVSWSENPAFSSKTYRRSRIMEVEVLKETEKCVEVAFEVDGWEVTQILKKEEIIEVLE